MGRYPRSVTQPRWSVDSDSRQATNARKRCGFIVPGNTRVVGTSASDHPFFPCSTGCSLNDGQRKGDLSAGPLKSQYVIEGKVYQYLGPQSNCVGEVSLAPGL